MNYNEKTTEEPKKRKITEIILNNTESISRPVNAEQKRQTIDFISEQYIINEDYLIVDDKKVLGKGSFGKVYSAIYYNKPVAIKILKNNPNIAELEREAKILL